MKRLALALLLLASPAAAQNISGPLQAQQNFREIFLNGSAAQSAARVNLGIGSTPGPYLPTLGGTLTGALTSVGIADTGGISTTTLGASGHVTLPGLLASGTPSGMLGADSSGHVLSLTPTGTGAPVLGTAPSIAGGALSGTFSGTPTLSGETTFSATGTALLVNNNAAVQGTLTTGTGSGAARITQGSTGNWVFQSGGAAATGGIYSGNSGTPALMTWNSASNSITSTNLFVLGTQNVGTPAWIGGIISAMTPFYSNLTWGGTSTVSGQPAPLAEFIQATDNVNAAGTGTALVYLAMNPGASHQGDAHLLQLSMLPLARTASTSSTTFDLLNFTVTNNFNQRGTALSPSSSAWGAVQSDNAVAILGPHATFLNNLSNSEDDLSAAGEIITASIANTGTMTVTAGCSATIAADDSVQSYAAWTLASNVVNVNTQIVSGSCTGSTGSFVTTPTGQTITSEQMVVGSSVYAKDFHLFELLQPDEVAGTGMNAALVFGATGSPTTSQGLTYLLQVGATITNNPIPNGWVLGYPATTPFGSGITTAGVFDFSNLTVTTAYIRSDATNSKFELDPSGTWFANSFVSGAPTGGSEGAGTINAASAYYANGMAGISKVCTITTAAVASTVTITITNGIVTATSGC